MVKINRNMRLKIVYFNYLYDLYEGALGSTIKAQRLLAALANCGHEIKEYWLNAKPDSTAETKVKSDVRTVLKHKFARYLHEINQIIANLKGFVKEYKILKKEKPDLLIIRLQSYKISAVILAKILKVPFLLEADCPSAYENRKFFPQYLKLPAVLEFFEKINFKLSDSIFVVSNLLKKYVVGKNIRSQKVTVIPNAADYCFNGMDNTIREHHNLNSKIVIGFVGSFHFWHGVSNLFYLIENILKKHANVAFLLVGHGGPVAIEVDNFIQENQLQNSVIQTGFVEPEKVYRYIQIMDIVLAPYPKLEFFYYSPVKIFEYMTYGKAIVSTKQGQIEEIIEDSKNGLLCEPDDQEGYCEKVNLLIENSNLREEFGKSAQDIALKEHTWQNRGDELSELCENVVLTKKIYP